MTSERLRILVVDADPQSRSLLTENLEDSGYSVARAENGRRAFDLLSTGGFDAILLDLVLPEMDGFRVLKRLKGDSSLRHIPVIVVSSLEDMESVTRCIKLGAADHLSKPLDPVLLRTCIRTALAARRRDEKEHQGRVGVSTPAGTGAVEPAPAPSDAGVRRAAAAEPGAVPGMGTLGFVRRFVRLIRPYRKETILVSLLLLLSILIAAAFPLGFKFITDYALLPHSLRALVLILLVLAAAEVAAALTDIGRDYFYARLSAKLLNDLRFNMFRHLQRLSMKFYGSASAGDITARFTTDLASVDNAITVCLQSAACQCLMIVFTLILLFVLEWRLALLSSVGLILSLRAERAVEPRAEAASRLMKDQQGKIAAVLQENVQAQPVVKIFRLQRLLIERFKRNMVDFFRTAARAGFLTYLTYRVPNRFVSFFGFLVIASGSFLVYQGELTIGTLVSFQLLLGGLVDSASELTWNLPQLLQAGVGMQRIEELLNEKLDVTDAPDAASLPRASGELVLKNVSFGYSAGRLNLEDISLTIPMNRSVLFVGPSGCGKSTVLNLLMRFYDPSAGSVSLGGRDIRSITQDSLRRPIGVVLQESFLFNLSIQENIRMGNLDATDDEIEAAAKAAEIHDVIVKMPDGYDTIVGERGGRLSGGQRQRVAIARAILSDPAILLLDEATSALDPATASSINKALERIGRGRTVISVTHRLESAPNADRVFVFGEGRLVEDGRHDELLQRNGLYAQLWRKQTGFSLSEDGTRAKVDAARLRDIPILDHLDDSSLSLVAGLFATERFEPYRLVVQQGDPGDKFYIIVRGRVLVFRTLSTGVEQTFSVLETGDHFGEIALIKSIPRTASVRTMADCVFLTLQREHFLNLVEAHPTLRETMETVVRERVSREPQA